MSKNLNRYYRRRAREEANSDLFEPFLATAFGALLLAGLAVAEFPSLHSFLKGVASVVLGVCAVGLRAHREGARRLAAALYTSVLFAAGVQALQEGLEWGHLSLLVYAACIATLVSDDTKERMAWARGERDAQGGPPP